MYAHAQTVDLACPRACVPTPTDFNEDRFSSRLILCVCVFVWTGICECTCVCVYSNVRACYAGEATHEYVGVSHNVPTFTRSRMKGGCTKSTGEARVGSGGGNGRQVNCGRCWRKGFWADNSKAGADHTTSAPLMFPCHWSMMMGYFHGSVSSQRWKPGVWVRSEDTGRQYHFWQKQETDNKGEKRREVHWKNLEGNETEIRERRRRKVILNAKPIKYNLNVLKKVTNITTTTTTKRRLCEGGSLSSFLFSPPKLNLLATTTSSWETFFIFLTTCVGDRDNHS